MQKRAGRVYSKRVKCAAFSEMFILVLATVAFTFILAESLVVSAGQAEVEAQMRARRSAQEAKVASTTPAPTLTPSRRAEVEAQMRARRSAQEAQVEASRAAAEKSAFGTKEMGDWEGSFQILGTGLSAALTVYGLVQGIAPAAGANQQLTNALSMALAGGIAAGSAAASLINLLGGKEGWAGVGGVVIGVAVAVVIYLAMYKLIRQRVISFSCLPWEAPIGGDNCEKCNGDPFRPCSEYRCRALGQACQLLNKDRPGREMCAWVNPHDVDSPKIAPFVDALGPASENLKYVTDTSIRPPALGVRIVRGNNECLKAFTPLRFGINTNEPAQCKIDTNHSLRFEQMQYYFGGSNYYEYNHTETMRLPGPQTGNNTAAESPLLRNDGTMQLFVRCRDANGNENADEYAIKFCVDPSPDTTPPLIEGASVANGNPVKFGTTNLSVNVYINEPAECKWSVESKAYEDMEMTMSCDSEVPQIINAIPTFVCVANLTGLKNNFVNKYYFRCKDQPGKLESERNVMVQSYEYTLKGSQPLNIIKVSPNGTTSGSSTAVNVDLEVETDDGAEEGKAICMFSPSGVDGTYLPMFETNSFRHKQTLQLISGVYTYHFRCVDLGGNSDDATTTFTVFSDLTAPKVARVYKEEVTGLKVVTDEDAECAYSLTNCNFVFDEGLKLIYSNPSVKTNSYLEWTPNVVYYIKCRDLYGNEPNPNECSVIVKAVESSTA